MKTYEEMANSALQRIDEKKQAIKHRNRTIVPIISLSLAVAIGIGVWTYAKPTGMSQAQFASESYAMKPGATDVVVVDDRNKTEVVTGFESEVSAACYASPKVGECLFFLEVRAAREKYKNKDVDFLLYVDIFQKDGTRSNEKQRNAELKRLANEGYRFYEVDWYDYDENDKRVKHTDILGRFSEEELKNFKPNESYGYAFSFMYGEVDFDDSKVVCSF